MVPNETQASFPFPYKIELKRSLNSKINKQEWMSGKISASNNLWSVGSDVWTDNIFYMS